jgi:hypothetical protein
MVYGSSDTKRASIGFLHDARVSKMAAALVDAAIYGLIADRVHQGRLFDLL